jgi:hypothetical protein
LLAALGALALAMPFWRWWPLVLWVGASVLTAGLLTPPWDRRLIRAIEEFAPVKRQWLAYLLIAILWVTVVALLYFKAAD